MHPGSCTDVYKSYRRQTGELHVHCKCGTTLCVEIGYIRCTTEVSFVSLEKQCLRCEGGKAKMTN